MTTTRRAAALIATLAAASTLGVGIAQAAPTAKVAGETQKMSGPSLKTTQTGSYPKGATITLVCFERGQSVKGALSPWHPNGGWDDLWYKTTDGVYVADIDIETGTNGTVAPACSVAPAAGAVQGVGGAAAAVVDGKVSKAVAWANSQVGSQEYPSKCELFVENAYGTSHRAGSAIELRNRLAAAGQIHMDQNIPVGALVFSHSKWDIIDGVTNGHVVIATGGGKYVSGGVSTAYGSRTTVQRLDSWNPAGGAEYLGWAYAPSDWAGR